MPDTTTRRFRVTGMDCADCAAHIEHAVGSLPQVTTARVSLASQLLTVQLADAAAETTSVERAVTDLGYQIGPAISRDGDRAPQLAPGYRRALWIVVALNAGYGVIELGGGFIANSQALKADALDFLGDGLITLLGVIAIGWGLAWRARAALLQGLFLGALGAGVLVNTLVRLQGGYEPEALSMGLFGVGALVVNVLAALTLLPHRTGDANVRAVWLFSRNDAIGNAAVVGAAVLVSWFSSAIPDVIVALVIGGLFLHSSWAIIRDARNDLRESDQLQSARN